MLFSKILSSMKVWIDSDSNSNSNSGNNKILFIRALPFIALHLICVYAFFEPVTAFALIVCAVSYSIRMFSITGIYHRYFSHKSFKLNRVWQFIFAVLGCAAVQRGPLWWAAHHRHHHQFSDKDNDIHSPVKNSFFWSHIGWFISDKNFHTDYSRVKDFNKFPELVWLNRYHMIVPLLFVLLSYYAGAALNKYSPELMTSGLHLMLWAFAIPTVLSWHATYTINSLSHKYGKKRYQTHDQSRNNWLLALITFGEGWHNNHHYYPASARQGFYWWEIDLTYYILRFLELFKIIHDLRPVPKKAYDKTNMINN
jgi:stearoyl-CoA desaturase (delta-9 desaturase)